MRAKSWFVLLAVTVLAAAAALWLVAARDERLAERVYGAPLYPGLAGRVNEIAELGFDTGLEQWTIRRDDAGVWRMAERGGYPADADRVKQAAVALGRAAVAAPKTADPAKHARLSLVGPDPEVESADDVKTVAMTAKTADGETLAALILGKTKQLPTSSEPGQLYVRREGDDRTWLVEGRFDIRKDPTAWLDKTLLKIERARVREVAVEHPGGETLRLKRNPYGDLRPVDMPEGRVTEDIRLTAAQRGLEFLPFADVRPADEVDMSGAVETTYRADDGTVVTVRTKQAGFETDGDPAYWVTFDIRHDPDSVSTEADMPELTGPDEEKPVIDPEEGAARAQAAMERAEGWAYLFAEFTAQNFIHSLDTVTSPEEES